MSKRTTIRTTINVVLWTCMAAILLTQPALACMDEYEEEQWYVEEEPAPVIAEAAPVRTNIECESDLECPASLLCEPVACLAVDCLGEDCEPCPTALCTEVAEGAQGRDCLADDDCGPGLECLGTATEPCGDLADLAAASCPATIGWCEAQHGIIYPPNDDSTAETLQGCQGGTDHSLPMSVALGLLLGATLRRRRLA